jgi:enoyl-CoA hydratase/carnithine racemase
MKIPNSMSGDRRVGTPKGQGGTVVDDDRFEHVTFTVDEGVAVATLNRPERLNAFTGRMGDELGRIYARCDADDSVRVVVLTGAGRAFCAGADFERGSETFASPSGGGPRRDFTASPIRPGAWEVRKPVIAAINGHAIGIGMTIPMQCDIRLVSESARLGFVHVRRGVIPDAQSHWTVPRAAGFAVAAELLLTGRQFTGVEAVELGLASRALPPDEVLPAALDVARDIARNTAPLSVALSKRLLWAGSPLGPDDVERLETEMHHVVMGRDDAREGVLAFVEKRDPEWRLSPTLDWPDDLEI